MTRTKQYIMPSGRLFFDPLDGSGNPTGEFYIGNTTDMTYKIAEERQEQFGASGSLIHKQASLVISQENSIEFTTDDMQPENLAMLYRGILDQSATVAITDVAETISNAQRSRYYQIGKSDDLPSGARHITVTDVQNGDGVSIPAALNYEIDSALGRLYILPTAPDVVKGVDLTVTYDIAASSRETIVADEQRFTGALRYLADNTFGENRDHYWPLVEIVPDGVVELKGLDWREISFIGYALKKDGFSKHYIDGRDVEPDGTLFQLVNRDFRQGTGGWLGTLTLRSSNTSNGSSAHTGDYYAYAGSNSLSSFYQKLAVPEPWWDRIDAGEVSVAEFSAWHESLASQTDNGYLFVDFRDDSDVQLSRVNGTSHQSATWEEVVFPETAVPVGTRIIYFGAVNDRDEGSSNDNYWDSFSEVGLVWSPV